MDPVLQDLIRYQELSLELSRLNARLEQFPLQIAAIDSGLETAASAVAAAKAAAADHQKGKRKLEMELQDLEVKLKKYNDQLMQVKTNVEYKTLQHEIAGVKEKIGGVEEKILLLMEEAESGERRIKEEGRLFDEQRREGESRKAVVRDEEARVKQEASKLSAAQATARDALGAATLDLFNRIALGRNGVAMARAREERCQGCNVRLRPQVFQEIKKNARLIQCDSCKRILYYLEEAPASSDTAPA